MPRVFSSVKEACIGIQSGTVDTAPVPTGQRFSCPITHAHCAGGKWSGSDFDSSEGMPLGWNVIVRVPVNEDIDRKEIDIGALGNEDLCRLKKEDPFLYYSIPFTRRKSLCYDSEKEDAITIENSSKPRRTTQPPDFRAQDFGAQQDPQVKNVSVVRRNRRLSTEKHPSLFLDEMMLSEIPELDAAMDDCDSNTEDVFVRLFT